MPPDLYALVCDYLVEFLPKEKQPEKVIKVTPEDGKFSDDEETENVPKTISKADRLRFINNYFRKMKKILIEHIDSKKQPRFLATF